MKPSICRIPVKPANRSHSSYNAGARDARRDYLAYLRRLLKSEGKAPDYGTCKTCCAKETRFVIGLIISWVKDQARRDAKRKGGLGRATKTEQFLKRLDKFEAASRKSRVLAKKGIIQRKGRMIGKKAFCWKAEASRP